jgi:hypothetical protein
MNATQQAVVDSLTLKEILPGQNGSGLQDEYYQEYGLTGFNISLLLIK